MTSYISEHGDSSATHTQKKPMSYACHTLIWQSRVSLLGGNAWRTILGAMNCLAIWDFFINGLQSFPTKIVDWMNKIFQTYTWPKNSVLPVKGGAHEGEIPV